MYSLNQIVHLFIGLCFMANFLPSGLHHLLTDDHEHDVHICDFESCYQEQDSTCYNPDIIDHKKLTFSDKPDSVGFHCIGLIRQLTTAPAISGDFLFKLLRGPPISL